MTLKALSDGFSSMCHPALHTGTHTGCLRRHEHCWLLTPWDGTTLKPAWQATLQLQYSEAEHAGE